MKASSLSLFLGMFLLGVVSFAQAGQRAEFFSVMEGVPLMPGFTEQTQAQLVFDKPEGRVVEAAAFSRNASLSLGEVDAFYKKSLPAFGWRAAPDAPNTYNRESERLQITTDLLPEKMGTYVHVTLAPNTGK